MTGARAMRLVIVLALLAVGGIVGMLLADGGWDWLFFAMTALPLTVGAGCGWRLRSRRGTGVPR